MAKTQEETVSALRDLEPLRLERGISGAVFSGVCAAEGWRPGKRVTESDFDAAVRRFTGSAMGTRGKRGC